MCCLCFCSVVAMQSTAFVRLSVCPCRVFGAGYPGLPTMTVDDWYEQRRRQGVVSAQSAPHGAPGTDRGAELGTENSGSLLSTRVNRDVFGVQHTRWLRRTKS